MHYLNPLPRYKKSNPMKGMRSLTFFLETSEERITSVPNRTGADRVVVHNLTASI
jgi:hypothetical protein